MKTATYRYGAHHYNNMGAVKSTGGNGQPQAQMNVLAYSAGASGGKAAPERAQVVLLGGDGDNAEPLAFFSANEARRMAHALNSAAAAAVSEPAEC